MKTKIKNASPRHSEQPATDGTRLAPAVTDLRHALSMVDPAIASRTAIAAMRHVLIERGRVIATDGELRIEAILPGAGVDAPPVLLQGDRLARIAATCDGGSELRLEPGDTTCTIKNKTGRWVLPTCSPDEFPGDSTGKTWPLARLPGDQLARCLRTVLPAVSRGKSPQAVSGLLIDVTDGVVTFVATDGYRLHAHAVEIDQATDNQNLVPMALVRDEPQNTGRTSSSEKYELCEFEEETNGDTMTQDEPQKTRRTQHNQSLSSEKYELYEFEEEAKGEATEILETRVEGSVTYSMNWSKNDFDSSTVISTEVEESQENATISLEIVSAYYESSVDDYDNNW